jgi:hypothetical protein
MKTFKQHLDDNKKKIEEDAMAVAPTNVVGGGAIAGTGGKGGEPGVPKNRKKRNPIMMIMGKRK